MIIYATYLVAATTAEVNFIRSFKIVSSVSAINRKGFSDFLQGCLCWNNIM